MFAYLIIIKTYKIKWLSPCWMVGNGFFYVMIIAFCPLKSYSRIPHNYAIQLKIPVNRAWYAVIKNHPSLKSQVLNTYSDTACKQLFLKKIDIEYFFEN